MYSKTSVSKTFSKERVFHCFTTDISYQIAAQHSVKTFQGLLLYYYINILLIRSTRRRLTVNYCKFFQEFVSEIEIFGVPCNGFVGRILGFLNIGTLFNIDMQA